MKIAAWGDSVTYGSCDEDALGWVGRLRKSFPIDDDHKVYNFGICGETTGDLIKRFESDAEAVKPDHIIFAIGINDTKQKAESSVSVVSKTQSINNLRTLIDKARAYGSHLTIIGPTNVDEAWRSARKSRFLNIVIKEYSDAFKACAAESNIPFIELFGLMDPTTELADGLHPNAKGYTKLYEIIKESLSE